METDLIQDGGQVKRQTDIDHHGPKYILIICHLPDPPIFSLPTTFKIRGSRFRKAKAKWWHKFLSRKNQKLLNYNCNEIFLISHLDSDPYWYLFSKLGPFRTCIEGKKDEWRIRFRNFKEVPDLAGKPCSSVPSHPSESVIRIHLRSTLQLGQVKTLIPLLVQIIGSQQIVKDF